MESSIITSDNAGFVQQFIQQNACWRCVLVMLKVESVTEYRKHSFDCFETQLGLKETDTCAICLGLLQRAESMVDQIAAQVQTQGYEFIDFKISVHVPLRAYLQRYVIIKKAEQFLGTPFKGIGKASIRHQLDFKEIFKWIVSPIVSKRLNVPANLEGAFWINCNFAVDEQTMLESIAADLDSLKFRSGKPPKRETKWNKKQNWKEQSADPLGADSIFQRALAIPPCLVEDLSVLKRNELQMQVTCSHDAILLAGRYCKLSRECSQSPWCVDGKTTKHGSVEEHIYNGVKSFFGADSGVLHGSGREDIDVRMLGRGRPFVLELTNPKLAVSCQGKVQEMEKALQGVYVSVQQLQLVDRDFFDQMKAAIEDKAKSYCAIVWCQKEITQSDCDQLSIIRDMQVLQKTPVRVLHRRSQLVREKQVYRMYAKYVNPHYMVLHVLASAGTYIKELVHGDLGRTTPSVGSILGTECDILQLDVTNVYDNLSEAQEQLESLFEVTIPQIKD